MATPSSIEYSTRVSADPYPRFQITTDGTMSWGDSNNPIGPTTNYPTLGFNTSWWALLNTSGAFMSTQAGSNYAFIANTGGDIDYRWMVTNGGVMHWGSGAGADDVIMSRTAAGSLTLQTQTATGVPLTLQGAASQSGDLFDIKNSAGAVLAGFGPNGRFYLNNTVASIVPLTINLAASQTGDAFQVYNNTPTKLTWIDSAGAIWGSALNIKSNGALSLWPYNNQAIQMFYLNNWADNQPGLSFYLADKVQFFGNAGVPIGRVAWATAGFAIHAGLYSLANEPNPVAILDVLGSPSYNKIMLRIVGGSAQTLDLAQYQNSANTVLAGMNYLGGRYGPTLALTNTVPSTVPLTVQAAASQSGDAFQIKNSTSTVLSGADSVGSFYLGATATSPDFRVWSDPTYGGFIRLGKAGTDYLKFSNAGITSGAYMGVYNGLWLQNLGPAGPLFINSLSPINWRVYGSGNPFTFQGYSPNGSNPVRFQDYGGTNAISGFWDTTPPSGSPVVSITPPLPGNVGIVIQAAASPTADLFQIKNSSGTLLAGFNSAGTLTGTGGISVNGNIQVNGTGSFIAVESAGGNNAYQAYISGNGWPNFTIQGSGLLGWGPGSGANDVSLNRFGVGALSLTASGTNNPTLYLLSTSGQGSQLYFTRNGIATWLLYQLTGDANFYHRDLVNARMQMTFIPGATVSAALTTINSYASIGNTTATSSWALAVATLNNADNGLVISGPTGMTGYLMEMIGSGGNTNVIFNNTGVQYLLQPTVTNNALLFGTPGASYVNLTMRADGSMYWGTSTTAWDTSLSRLSTGGLQATVNSPSIIPFTIQGAASQSTDYFGIRDSGGTRRLWFDSNYTLNGLNPTTAALELQAQNGINLNCSGQYTFGALIYGSWSDTVTGAQIRSNGNIQFVGPGGGPLSRFGVVSGGFVFYDGYNSNYASITPPPATDLVDIVAVYPGKVPLVIKQAPSTTSDSLQIKNSSGTVLYGWQSNGMPYQPNTWVMTTGDGLTNGPAFSTPSGQYYCRLSLTSTGYNREMAIQAGDVNAILGSLRSTATVFSGIAFMPTNGTAVAAITPAGGAVFGGTLSTALGGGTGPILFIGNDTADPNANPTGGTLLFSSTAGTLKARTPDGTVTQIAPAQLQFQTVRVTASGSVTVPAWATVADVTLVAGGGGGGGGGAAALTSGVANQVGGAGGGAGGDLQISTPVVPNDTLTVTVGNGGTGGTGAVASTGAAGVAGGLGGGGSPTSITGNGISYTVIGGGPGRAGGANTGTASNAGVKGSNANGANAAILYGQGTGSISGAVPIGGGPGPYAAGGGTGGVIANATNGGVGGAPGTFLGQTQVNQAQTATATGGNSINAANNSGAGGGAGGGGAPGGAGGNGGNGGSGFAVVTFRSM